MQRPSSPRTRIVSCLCAAALSACGGGGGDAGLPAGSTTIDTATGYAANATVMVSDAGSALDASVQTTQLLVSAQAGHAVVTAAPLVSAVSPSASASLTCAGGGSATLAITGGTPTSIVNGVFDTGEVYSLVFAACKGNSVAAALTGTLTLSVVSATSTGQTLALVASGLTVALPAGSVTIDGSATQTTASTSATGGLTTTTSRFTSPSFTLTTQRNARSNRFTLSDVDITRSSVALNGVLQSSSFSGTHTLSATLANVAFSYTVATTGSVSYSASGAPTAGVFTITLPRALVGVAFANGNATITVDEGKDGTVDRSVTLPIATLQAAAN